MWIEFYEFKLNFNWILIELNWIELNWILWILIQCESNFILNVNWMWIELELNFSWTLIEFQFLLFYSRSHGIAISELVPILAFINTIVISYWVILFPSVIQIICAALVSQQRGGAGGGCQSMAMRSYYDWYSKTRLDCGFCCAHLVCWFGVAIASAPVRIEYELNFKSNFNRVLIEF